MGCGPSQDAAQTSVQKDIKPVQNKANIDEFSRIMATSERKERSWYVQSNKSDETITRNPGDLNGNQFNCANLKDCKIIVKDLCDSMLIDDCDNCEFMLASIRGSIFARSCKNCKFVMVCGQFRCVDCFECDFFMHARTGPVVESSKNVRIGCALINYPELAKHMEITGIDRFSNLWTDVHDFTPADGNFQVVSGQKLSLSVSDFGKSYVPFFINRKPGSKCFTVKVSIELQNEVVELSHCEQRFVKIEKSQDSTCLFCTVTGKGKEEVESVFENVNPLEISSTD